MFQMTKTAYNGEGDIVMSKSEGNSFNFLVLTQLYS